MLREFAFSTFLKILELKDAARLTALKGMQRGGGYQYWRPLSLLSPQVMRNELLLDDIEGRVSELSNGHQAKYNTAALRRISEWVTLRDVVYRRRPAAEDRIIYPIGSIELSVKIEPEVAFAMNDGEFHMQVWATRSPTLSEQTLSMGMFLFRKASRKAGRTQRLVIFDTVKDRLFYETDILRNAEQNLEREIRDIDRQWILAEDSAASRRRPSGPAEDRATVR